MAALKGAVAHFKKAKLKLIAALRGESSCPARACAPAVSGGGALCVAAVRLPSRARSLGVRARVAPLPSRGHLTPRLRGHTAAAAADADVKESPVPIPGFGQGAATIPTSNTVLELGTQLDAATRRAVKAAKAKRAAAKAAAVAPAEAPVSADLEEAVAPPSAAAAPKLASQLVGLRDEKAVLAQLCYFERKTLAEGEL